MLSIRRRLGACSGSTNRAFEESADAGTLLGRGGGGGGALGERDYVVGGRLVALGEVLGGAQAGDDPGHLKKGRGRGEVRD